MLVDPHGDLADAVREALPRRRRNDLIWIDVGSDTQKWRLDLLHTPGLYPAAERNRIANQLVAYFKQVYSGTPEAFGPAFELFFRNTIFLLCLAEDPADRSLMKFEDVLTNKSFRTKLLKSCNDAKVVQFWNEIAEEITGDWKLENMAPYIVCKMSQITGNPLTRTLISGDNPRLDLRRAMDERKIVLVRLSKGIIGEYDARFVGALFLMALIEAAMGRCRTPVAERTPFRVYVDEFQTLASDMAAIMLAECRKFGLSLTLANQSLGQLDSDWYSNAKVAHAALANCGSLAVFRTSLTDAKAMAPMLNMEDHSEFMTLGVGEMIVRRLCDGLPMPAERLVGLAPIAAARGCDEALTRPSFS